MKIEELAGSDKTDKRNKMRITAKQLRQIIKEDLSDGPSDSSKVTSEELGVTDDKMFNASMTVEGLTQTEYDSIKQTADTRLGDAGFFVIDNTSENPVQVTLADFGEDVGVQDPFELSANTRSKFIGFSKEALTREEGRPARILVTGTHNAAENRQSVDDTRFKLVRSSVNQILADEDYVAVLIKLKLGTARVDTPAEEPKEAPPVAATKISPAVPAELVAAVTKQPLQVGSKGDNVRIVQRAIKAAIQSFLDKKGETETTAIDIPSTEVAGIKRFVPGIAADASSKQMLQALVTALDDDGDYGNMTKTAVKIYQRLAGIAIDGRVGKETAGKLQAENMSINEAAMIINRWNRLAGLLSN